MREVAAKRWFIDVPGLEVALKGAARVHAVANPHITRWLKPLAELDPEPALFPRVEQRCQSFSQWWTRATRGYHRAEELR